MSIRCILHADLDAFYASVEQMDHPEMRSKPILVGGPPRERGVVVACSYEARAYGIHSAMPMRTALNLHPQAIVVHPRFDRYRQVSNQVMAIFGSTTPLVQPLSLDEAFLDVTAMVTAGTSPVDMARMLRERVKQEVGLIISVGVATSKSVAKIASDFGKPDGLVTVEPGQEQAFLAPLQVKSLPGIGPQTERRLLQNGITTLGDLASQTELWAQRFFGKRGPEILAMSRGEDNRRVTTDRVAKSISAETTFVQDISNPEIMASQIARLSQRVVQRLSRSGAKGKTVTVKLRLADFTTFTRSITLASPVSDCATIKQVAQHLLDKEQRPGRCFRLLGVGISGFSEARQLPMFGY